MFKTYTKKIVKPLLFTLLALNLNAMDFTEKSLEKESVNTVSWIQTSAEYKMLAIQAFNAAQKNLAEIKANNKNNKKLAVVVDLDETMIDNSPYAAWRIIKGKGYGNSTWKEWVNDREAAAVPGAVEFSKFVEKNNLDIFYVSNRSNKTLKETMKNLKKLGFTQVDKNHIFLKSNSSDKTKRRKYIKKLGYDIVMLIGDQLTDFSDEVYKRNNDYRNKFTEKNKDKFGYNWIVIPNPTYGDFESSGVSDQFYTKITGEKTSLKEQSEFREKRLNIWDGE